METAVKPNCFQLIEWYRILFISAIYAKHTGGHNLLYLRYTRTHKNTHTRAVSHYNTYCTHKHKVHVCSS